MLYSPSMLSLLFSAKISSLIEYRSGKQRMKAELEKNCITKALDLRRGENLERGDI